MRVLLQRVRRASVEVDGETVAEIGHGLLLLVGVGRGDTQAEAEWLAQKCVGLRVFEDSEGRSNLSLQDVAGEVLVVPQFTLYADTSKGRRPSFVGAAEPGPAERLVEYFAEQIRQQAIRIQRGRFGAHMVVQLENDGPVTIMLEREPESD